MDIFERAASLKRAAQPFVLATVTWSQRPTSARPGAKGIITPDGALFGWVGGSCAQPVVVREALQALGDGQSRLVRLDPAGEVPPGREGVVTAVMTCHSGGALEIFLEPCLPPLQLVVAGESPVADALARLGHVMGYRVITVRPGAGETAPPEADARLDSLDLAPVIGGRRTVVVVASMGCYDEEAVLAALRAGAGFVALVASHRRHEAVVAATRAEGLPEATLARLKAPAGLDIGASAPEEIAVSIIAEIICRRASLPPPTAPVADPSALATAAIDPVCGMEVAINGARHWLDHAGSRYYFCCPSCRRQFAQEPDRFLAAGR